MSTLYDISPPLHPGLAVFPGDTPLSRETLLDLGRDDHLTLSTIHATVHLGAHADAPSHYGRDAATMEQQPLELYLGPCQVMRPRAVAGRALQPEDLTAEIVEPRLLLATGTYPDPDTWREDFAWIDPSCVDHCADAGVRLLGVDTPSVDAGNAKSLVAHAQFLARGVAILEGLVLHEVPDGRYELIALPLPLVGFDASPVRAVLRTLD